MTFFDFLGLNQVTTDFINQKYPRQTMCSQNTEIANLQIFNENCYIFKKIRINPMCPSSNEIVNGETQLKIRKKQHKKKFVSICSEKH